MKKQSVLICGCDGYIGFPLTLKLLDEGHTVVGIDNLSRRKNVEEMNSFSAVNILSYAERVEKLKEIGNFQFLNYDLKNDITLKTIFRDYQFDTVVNLAQQPSAPFSQKSLHHAITTHRNNTESILNLLWNIKNTNKNIHLITIGTMGEYDPTVGVEIPEGKFKFWHKFRKSKESLFPRRPGSFYHASKVSSTYYIDFACRIWGLKATDIMQGIVYGNWTEETEKYKLNTRLDSDEAFGTVFNRFVIQAILGHPLTIYGEGKHKRGFLSLYDSIQCLMIAIKNPPQDGEYRTWNQLVKVHSMNNVANTVINAGEHFNLSIHKNYIHSPRVEETGNFFYKPTVKTLYKLGYVDDGTTMLDEAFFLFDYLSENPLTSIQKDQLKKVITPKINWR